MIAGFLLPMKMTLQFHIDVVPAKNADQLLHAAAPFFHATACESKSQWTIVVASKADQSSSMFSQFFFPHRALAFGRAQLHLRNQAAEVLISEPGRDKKRKAKFTTETERHRGMVSLIF